MFSRIPRAAARGFFGPMLVFIAGCSDVRSVSAPSERTPTTARNTSTNPLWSQLVDGETGPGSVYRLYMPRAWNGKLVIYAHGIVAPFLPVALPAEGDGMAAIFGSQGFAVALSSYSGTGLVIADGVRRTHQLAGLFAAKFGPPSRTYLAGSSMGGFIVTALAEQHPNDYAGVLPMCGVVGGFTGEFSYVFNARLLFDALYPGVLPGSILSVPMPSDPTAALVAINNIQNRAATAILSDTRPVPGALQIALIDQTAMPLPAALGGPLTPAQFGAFAITPLLLQSIFVNDIIAETHGHFPFSNAGAVYTSSAPFMAPFVAALNASVQRIPVQQDAINWVQNNGETSGRLAIPMLTLHTRYDTWVPIITESIYRQKVNAAGASDLLVQRTTDGFDHCNFSASEIAQGMIDLTRWVEQGVKPAP